MVATPPAERTAAAAPQDISGLYAHFIGGQRVQPDGSPDLVRNNPAAADQVLGSLRSADVAMVHTAVRTAVDAWPKWRNTPAPTRGRELLEVARLMDQHREELARLISLEEGKPIKDARAEVQRSINITEFMSGEGRRYGGYTSASESVSKFAFTTRQPLGVVACITPWNFPLAIPAWKIAPALIAGNSVILKPASATPASAVRLAELFKEAGLPDGVLTVLAARGGSAAEVLLDAEEVRAVSLTGSTATGRHVAARCAARGVAVQGELGGKNAAIVLADADLDLATAGVIDGAFGSTGQRCTATSRTIVVESVADRFLDKVLARAGQLKVGAGLDESTDVGPAVTAEQRDSVLEYLDIGRAEGAVQVLGGDAAQAATLPPGHWLSPTIFDRVQPSMRVAREEIFGPVLSIIRVPDAEAAFEAANGVEYGLAASVYTRDVRAIFQFVDRVDVGIAHVNQPTLGGEVHLPFGGVKASGIGPHEQGREAIDFFTKVKSVYINYA
ncbi:MAG: aldehyde dehydrogenase family protein [Chloroflexota bacterium]|nr:aldehyde dehydrogenase family protein [Chloroflexota bacterium]